jgi:outer membrane protein OmpA-like peptidoglycan-associated protein
MRKFSLLLIPIFSLLTQHVAAESAPAAPVMTPAGTAPTPTNPTPVAASPAPSTATVAGGDVRQFSVFSGRPGRPNHYIPSGYMGDNTLALSGGYVETHDGKGNPLKITYHSGPKGWAGLYWQHPANNWGDKPGNAGFNLTGAKRLSFWARGEKGGEKIHEVKVGGIVGRYPDSDVVSRGPIKLSKQWQRFDIDLTGKNLQHIIGGFALSMSKHDNIGKTTIYLDDIGFEVPVTNALPAVADTVEETTPAAAKPALPPELPKTSENVQVKAEDSGLRVSFSSQLLFTSGQTVLQPESHKVLDEVVGILKAYPTNEVMVEGHTDNIGNAEYNLQLSRLRAEHVRDYFVKTGGFDRARFRVVGYGQTQPIADNKTRSGRAQNRRVEVIILKTQEKR